MPVITGPADTDTVQYWQDTISQKWGAAAGEAYVSFYDSHPGMTPEGAASDFIEIILVQGLDTAISTGVTVGAAAPVGATEAGVQGAEQAVNTLLSPTQFLTKLWSGLTNGHTWVRVAEGVLGIALVLVAVAELGKGTAIGNAVKKVPLI
jgi:hypothetical protein